MKLLLPVLLLVLLVGTTLIAGCTDVPSIGVSNSVKARVLVADKIIISDTSTEYYVITADGTIPVKTEGMYSSMKQGKQYLVQIGGGLPKNKIGIIDVVGETW